MIERTANTYLLPPTEPTNSSATAENTTKINGSPFGSLYEQAREQVSAESKSLEEAGRRMEVMITTMVLKTMEESSTEGGLLGTKSQGMGHFKDLFLEKIAEDMVEKGGLGIREALAKAHGPN